MKLLLIEDEQELGDNIQKLLLDKKYICEWVTTVAEALDKISFYDYDCVLLDLMLQGANGLEVLKELKRQHKLEAVIIISAIETLEARLEGLRMGADDYLTKPFHLSELLARIEALLRRKNFKGNNIVSFNEIIIDVLAKTVCINHKLIDATKKEMDLLLYLIANENRVLSKAAIAEHLSGDMAEMLDNYDFVYAHVKNLKKKMNAAGAGDYIKSVYGLGYKWKNE